MVLLKYYFISVHSVLAVSPPVYSFASLNLRELPITETELKLMAAAAMTGLSSSPNTG